MITDLLIGGIGGIVSRSTVAPIELNRLQMQNRFIPNSTLRDVYKKEGLRHFWKGNGTNCVRVFPQLSINYAVFRKTKKLAENHIQNQNILNFTSGCISGFTSMMITYPLETTRTYLRLQKNKNKFNGIFDALRKIPEKKIYTGCKMGKKGGGV